MIKDTHIYRLENIQEEIEDLLDESDAIIAGSDDELIVNHARSTWIYNIRTQLRGMEKTIQMLWDRYYHDKR